MIHRSVLRFLAHKPLLIQPSALSAMLHIASQMEGNPNPPPSRPKEKMYLLYLDDSGRICKRDYPTPQSEQDG